MSMSVAPLAAIPPPTTSQKSTSDIETSKNSHEANAAAKASSSAVAPKQVPTVNELSFDPTGLMVIRTVRSDDHQIVGQLPSEAYLRLAQAMTETVRADNYVEPSAETVA